MVIPYFTYHCNSHHLTPYRRHIIINAIDRAIQTLQNHSPFVKRVFQNLEWKWKCIQVNGEYRGHLRFINGIISFHNLEELQNMLRNLNKSSLELGFSININKTKVMQNKYVQDKINLIIWNNVIVEKKLHVSFILKRIYLFP